MTVEELNARLSLHELIQWDEWYRLEAEAEKKAAETAKKQQQRGR